MFTLVIYGTKNSLPGVLAGKCDGSTCAVLKSDLSTVQTCFKDPSDVACTGTITENLYHTDERCESWLTDETISCVLRMTKLRQQFWLGWSAKKNFGKG